MVICGQSHFAYLKKRYLKTGNVKMPRKPARKYARDHARKQACKSMQRSALCAADVIQLFLAVFEVYVGTEED